MHSDRAKAVGIKHVSELNRKILIDTVKSLLDAVGKLPTALQQGELAIHYRKNMTDEEIREIPGLWCALPAMDDVGQGLVMLEENT